MKKKVQFLTVELFTESSNVCITNEQNKTNTSQYFQMHIFGFVWELLDNFSFFLIWILLLYVLLVFLLAAVKYTVAHTNLALNRVRRRRNFFFCSGKIHLAHVVAHSQVYIELRMRTFIAPVCLYLSSICLFVCCLFLCHDFCFILLDCTRIFTEFSHNSRKWLDLNRFK